MALFASVGFLAPWLLLGLLGLPVLWWLLRAVPPAAIKRRFPGVTLLLGLKDPETTPDKTPWWLLLLRLLAVAALIIGFAGPILNPDTPRMATGPLLILRDGGWASAPDWAARQARVEGLLADAARLGRPTAMMSLAEGPDGRSSPEFQDARTIIGEALAEVPMAWEGDEVAFAAWLDAAGGSGFETIWLTDGLMRDGRDPLLAALQARGQVTVIDAERAVVALGPAGFDEGKINVPVFRSLDGGVQAMRVSGFGPDPSGVDRLLASVDVTFAPGKTEATATFDLPSELRNRLKRFALSSVRSAGAVTLADDALKRRKVALFAGKPAREGQELVSSLHFLKKALEPTADLIEAPLAAALLTSPDVVILADVAKLTAAEADALSDWVKAGGLLLRFAGPELAASTLDRAEDDPLLPVRLRAGGRNVGGAMSWGSPKALQPFAKGTPFFGLVVPADVEVSSQVLAQPDPFLGPRTMASLQDGTPLVTGRDLGDGQIILFHVTANAEWSTLPLSGLFVQMLERLAISSRRAAPAVEDLAGQIWTPHQVMTGFGDLTSAESLVAVAGERLAEAKIGRDLQPGLYTLNDREIALNVMSKDRRLVAASWPDGVTVESLTRTEPTALKAWVLTIGLGLLLLDILATLLIGGRLRGPRAGVIASALLAVSVGVPDPASAQDEMALQATKEPVLAYIQTGDAQIDATAEAGLFGLSQVLARRTSIEPGDPMGLELETDELTFFPIIYWPMSENQPLPSDAAIAKLNGYLQTGGMILFDTRDANLGGLGAATPAGRRLRAIAASLNIPALEPIPQDHVLTRTFYLLQDFPGRHARSDIWVEASPKDAVQLDGVPFRNLNDGVSPVVIGGNDWASAWATTREGRYMFPVGRGGSAGERQREIAFRFGVNLVMYVLTGNYKSDQVHVPALLERLGQ